jgi:plasmid stabilization system protein ParE
MTARFTRRALNQIEEIRAHVAIDSPAAADAVVRRIRTVADLVAQHPSMGRATTLRNVRVFGALPHPYLVFYRSDADGGALILRVRHMARGQDWRTGR